MASASLLFDEAAATAGSPKVASATNACHYLVRAGTRTLQKTKTHSTKSLLLLAYGRERNAKHKNTNGRRCTCVLKQSTKER